MAGSQHACVVESKPFIVSGSVVAAFRQATECDLRQVFSLQYHEVIEDSLSWMDGSAVLLGPRARAHVDSVVAFSHGPPTNEPRAELPLAESA